MKGVDTIITGTAVAFLLLSLATMWWATRSPVGEHQRTIRVFAWLCAALAATLVLFSLFPSSRADGNILGITVSGASAFVLLVWLVGLRSTAPVPPRSREPPARQSTTPPERESTPLDHQEIMTFPLHHAPRRSIGIITGDIRRVRSVDIWVNSENTDMTMSRIHEFSVSAIIRYLGAQRDDAGRIVVDLIADDLSCAVDGRPVAAGAAVVTTAGALEEANGVRHIIHVAAVQGSPGAGFRPVAELGRCIYSALEAADALNSNKPIRTILFPLLGTGQAGGAVDGTARTLISAARDYLTSKPTTKIRTAYLLAFTDRELAACLRALSDCGLGAP